MLGTGETPLCSIAMAVEEQRGVVEGDGGGEVEEEEEVEEELEVEAYLARIGVTDTPTTSLVDLTRHTCISPSPPLLLPHPSSSLLLPPGSSWHTNSLSRMKTWMCSWVGGRLGWPSIY